MPGPPRRPAVRLCRASQRRPRGSCWDLVWPPSIPGLVFGVPIAIAVTAIWSTRWPTPEGLAARGWRWLVLLATAALVALFWAFALVLGVGAVLTRGLSKLGNAPRATRPPTPPRNRGQRPAPQTPTPAPSSPPRRPTTAEAAIGGGPPGLWDPPRERLSHAAHTPPDVLTTDLRDHEQALRDWQAFRHGDRHSP